jgi:hypothetical protein
MNTLHMADAGNDKTARRISTAVVLALALSGAYLIGMDEKPIVSEATAETSVTAISQDWQYFPDLFVNQGTQFEETYIEQF